MSELIELRDRINRIDEALASLFVDRMDAVKHIAIYKQKNKLPIVDQSREAHVIAENLKRVPKHLKPYFETFLTELMSVSKKYQHDIL